MAIQKKSSNIRMRNWAIIFVAISIGLFFLKFNLNWLIPIISFDPYNEIRLGMMLLSYISLLVALILETIYFFKSHKVLMGVVTAIVLLLLLCVEFFTDAILH
jgi:hypothetical protein